jgi:carbon starvation protein CstA
VVKALAEIPWGIFTVYETVRMWLILAVRASLDAFLKIDMAVGLAISIVILN